MIYSSPAIGPDGAIYIGSDNNKLFAINPNGTLRWTVNTVGYTQSTPAIGADGTIYVGSYDANVYAINPNGTIKWVKATGNIIYSSPAIGADGVIYIGSADHQLYALNPNGTQKWAFTAGDAVHSSPAIGRDGTIYVGSDDHKLYALNAPISFTVTPSAGANGAITPNTTQTVPYGGSVSFTATPSVNYVVDSWFLDNVAVQTGIPTYTVGNVTANHTVKVTFKAQPHFTITPSAGTFGTITPTTPQTVTFFSILTFTATANAGYTVDSWALDNTTVQTGGAHYTVSHATANHTVKATFKPLPTFTVTPTSSPTLWISPNTPQTVYYSGSVTFTASPIPTFYAVRWSLDNVVVQLGGLTYTVVNVTANHAIHLTYSPMTYTVTPTAGANGTVSPTAPQTAVFYVGSTFTATPNVGYTVDSWFLDNTLVHLGGSTYSVDSIVGNHALKVTFKPLMFTVTPSAGFHGAISPNTVQTVSYGGNVTFMATSITSGYTADSWSLDNVVVQTGGSSYTVSNVTANHTIIVTFKLLSYIVTPSAGFHGVITPTTPLTVSYGFNVSFTATANAGYTVDSWALDGTPVQTGGAHYTVTNVTANHTVKVTFKPLLYSVTPSAGSNGTITPNVPQTVAFGTNVTFTATANAGYTVDSWSLDSTPAQTGGSTYTVNNVTANHTVKVTFKPLPTFTVTPWAYANGTISPNTTQTVPYGGSVSCTATANAGYTVDNWSLDSSPVQTGGSTYTVTNVTASHIVMVTFKPLPKLTVTPSAGLHGIISPNAVQTVSYGGNVSFTATANAGYTVDSWMLDSTPVQTGGTNYTVTNVIVNHTVKVTFKPLLYIVTPSAGSNGTITPNVPQTVAAGTNVTFIATANAGYTVDSWLLDSLPMQTGGSTFTFFLVYNDHTVKVTFKPLAKFTVTPSAGPNGVISPNTVQTVLYGGSVTFTATANAGYMVDSWSLDSTPAQTGGSTYTVANVTASHTVMVTFKPLAKFTVTPSAGPNGVISPNTVQTVLYGGSVSFTATANAGYTVDIWSLDSMSAQTGGSTYTVTNVTASHTVMVTFKPLPKVTVTPSAGANGTISPNTVQTVLYGGSVSFTATANAGYTVDSWSLNNVLVQTGGAHYTVSNVVINEAITVTFRLLTFVVTPFAGPNGRISPNTPQTLFYGETVTFTAAANAGYTVDSWLLNGTSVQTGGAIHSYKGIVTLLRAAHIMSIDIKDNLMVTFKAVGMPNDAPTITQAPYLAVKVNSGPQTVPLYGIIPGDSDDAGQSVTISALSSNPALIPNPTVSYTSPNTTGTLLFTPNANASGTALITVKVQDNGGTAGGGSDTTTMSFLVSVRASSGLLAWGNNTVGQSSFSTASTSVLAIAGGWYHTVALKQDGTVQCWGGTNDGEAIVPSGLSGVTAIAAGGTHTVVLLNTGKVVAWGNNFHGECTVPTAALSGVAAIAAGDSHTVALKYDGTLLCWGSNASGQCTVPTGVSGVVAIAAGAAHTVALLGNGTVIAWGDNTYQQSTIPAGLTGVQAIAAGAYHTLALKSNGQVVAWGANNYGQSTPPASLTAGGIAAGKYHSMALQSNGTVVCWGAGHTNTGMTPEFGQSMVPAGLHGVLAVAAGGVHTIVICPLDPLTSLTLSATTVLSNQPLGTTVGIFATQPGYLAPFTYTLVSGTGSTDNASFTIAGNVLRTRAVFAYAQQASFSIRVRTTDQFGRFLEQTFTITVLPTITALDLTPRMVMEFSPIGTVVGKFTTQPAGNGPFTYLLVNGAGSADNALFSITGDQLKVAGVLDAVKKPTCSIRVRTVDRYAQYAEAPVTIGVIPQYRPDLWISNDYGKTWLGQNLFSTDGSNQLAALTCNGAATAYVVAVLNLGASADSYQFTLSGGNSAWTVANYDTGVNPPQLLTGTSWTTPSVTSGGFHLYLVYVQPNTTVVSGTVLTLTISATSKGNSTRMDAVKAQTTRK